MGRERRKERERRVRKGTSPPSGVQILGRFIFGRFRLQLSQTRESRLEMAQPFPGLAAIEEKCSFFCKQIARIKVKIGHLAQHSNVGM